MSATDHKRVLAMADLARIDLTAGQNPEEAAKTLDLFAVQFENIVRYMDILGEADTTGIEPLYWPLAFAPSPPRNDEAGKLHTREEILAGAPDQDGGFFVVPSIL